MREGKVVHRELELHGKGVVEARSRRARSAAVNGPPVGLGIYEAPIVFEVLDVSWFGFIDVVGAKDKRGRWVPVTEGGHWVVMDWKAQPNSEPVLLERGWTPMGDVRVGDRIYGSDGQLHDVLGVHPQGEREVWEVGFSDGQSVRCDAEHLWTFEHYTSGTRRTKTAREWAAEELRGRKGAGNRRWRLPQLTPPKHAESAFSVAPYTLGALIGDGGLSQYSVLLTTADPEILAHCTLPDGVSWRKRADKNCGAASSYIARRDAPSGANPLVAALRDLGLWGHKAPTKYIPSNYFLGSESQRLALLQGLMDTDGSVQKKAAALVTSSRRLAEDVRALVSSLGGRARISDAYHVYRGERRLYFTVTVKMPIGVCPFRLTRKKVLYESHVRTEAHVPKRYVTSFTATSSTEQSTCLSVSAPDRLYVTKGYVLTHNTTSSLDNALDEDGLRNDVAANVYAYAAFEAGASRVTCRWVYVTDHATPQVDVVEVEMRRSEVGCVLAVFAAGCREAQFWLDSSFKLGDVPGRTGECHAFRRPCPALSICPHYALSLESESVVQISTKPRRDRMRDDFEAQVATVTAPSVPAVPSIPGLPVIPAIPAVPPPSAPSLPVIPSLPMIPSLPAVPSAPVVDKSVINAPEGVAVPLSCPEEAERVINEIYPPEAVETDELEAMDAPALKALAAKEGVTFSPRQQAKSLRAAIRTERRRKIVEGDVQSVPRDSVEASEPQRVVVETHYVDGDVTSTAAVVGGQVAPGVFAEADSVEEKVFVLADVDEYRNAGPTPPDVGDDIDEGLLSKGLHAIGDDEPSMTDIDAVNTDVAVTLDNGDYSDDEAHLAASFIVFLRAFRRFLRKS